jgi:hypothetical protein
MTFEIRSETGEQSDMTRQHAKRASEASLKKDRANPSYSHVQSTLLVP